MNSSELLVIIIVAVVVFGPRKLPMLAEHLAKAVRAYQQIRLQLHDFWNQQLNEQQLMENQKKAEQAEEKYQQEQ